MSMPPGRRPVTPPLTLTLTVSNRTSGSTYPAKGPMPRMAEHHERGLVLDVAKKVCAKGHTLTVQIVSKGLIEDVDLEGDAKVVQVENRDGTCDQIRLEWQHVDTLSWAVFRSGMDHRLKMLQELFETMRGEK